MGPRRTTFASLARSTGWIAPAVIALTAAGCGSGVEASAPAPPRSDFPKVEGRVLEEIASDVGISNELVVLPAGGVFKPGPNRFAFGLFTVRREQIENAEVAVYAAHGPTGRARGPFPARFEPLVTEPAFVAKTTAGDADAATTVYVTRLPLSAKGEWRLLAVVRDDEGALDATRIPSLEVKALPDLVSVGDQAPEISTPTVNDVGQIAEIDTRVPPDTMHEIDFADAISERPIVLQFATPTLCTSRVCGPVVDIAEQVHRDFADSEVAFIHMEVYRENSIDNGVLPQLEAFGLPSEPWLFVIDEQGVVRTAVEGGFSVEELTGWVEDVAK